LWETRSLELDSRLFEEGPRAGHYRPHHLNHLDPFEGSAEAAAAASSSSQPPPPAASSSSSSQQQETKTRYFLVRYETLIKVSSLILTRVTLCTCSNLFVSKTPLKLFKFSLLMFYFILFTSSLFFPRHFFFLSFFLRKGP
jgi:hypothetical protein